MFKKLFQAKSLEENLNEKTEQLKRKTNEFNDVVNENDKISKELVDSKKTITNQNQSLMKNQVSNHVKSNEIVLQNGR